MYNEELKIYHSSYIRNARAIGVLWAIFTICFGIINLVVFIQPFWIGDSKDTPMTGHFGLYRYCLGRGLTQTLQCEGRLDDFTTIPSDAFKAATFFVGFSFLMILICIICMLLFFCVHAEKVYKICMWLQIVSDIWFIDLICLEKKKRNKKQSNMLSFCEALCMFLACVIYPAGWDNSLVAGLCANGAEKYQQGECTIRWAYILAIIGIFDAAILAALAFFLADRQEKLAFASHGLINGGPAGYGMGDRAASISGRSIGSKRSFQPAPLAPEPTEAYNYHAEPMPLDRRTYQSKRRGSGAGSQISSSGAFYL